MVRCPIISYFYCKYLQDILDVSDSSPLKDRDVRNHFEHFDERVHEWAVSVSGEAFVDSSIMPLSRLEGMNPKNVARNFDQSTFSVTFFGDSFQLEPVIKEIESLYARAKVELEKTENALLEE